MTLNIRKLVHFQVFLSVLLFFQDFVKYNWSHMMTNHIWQTIDWCFLHEFPTCSKTWQRKFFLHFCWTSFVLWQKSTSKNCNPCVGKLWWPFWRRGKEGMFKVFYTSPRPEINSRSHQSHPQFIFDLRGWGSLTLGSTHLANKDIVWRFFTLTSTLLHRRR